MPDLIELLHQGLCQKQFLARFVGCLHPLVIHVVVSILACVFPGSQVIACGLERLDLAFHQEVKDFIVAFFLPVERDFQTDNHFLRHIERRIIGPSDCRPAIGW